MLSAREFLVSLSLPCVSGMEIESSAKLVSRQHRDEPGSQANSPLMRMGARMRSELVYSAGLKIENRFLLSAMMMRAVRMMHVNSARTEDTLNRVFAEVAEGRFTEVELPEITPPPAIDALVITPLV